MITFPLESQEQTLKATLHSLRNGLAAFLSTWQLIQRKYQIDEKDPLVDSLEKSIEQLKFILAGVEGAGHYSKPYELIECEFKKQLETTLNAKIEWEGESGCWGFSQTVCDWFFPFLISSLKEGDEEKKVWIRGKENQCSFSLEKEKVHTQHVRFENPIHHFASLLLLQICSSSGAHFQTLSKITWELSFPKTYLA